MSNQTFIFQGTLQQITETVINPYYGQTFTLNGIYNVNTGTYNGTGTGNTLLMTNSPDAMFVLDSNNVQTISDIQRIITGNGNDFLDLASATVNLGDLSIFGGSGNETIWDGSGNDTITTGNGNNNIVGGRGNDVITTGSGSDTIYIGSGNNTVSSGGGDDNLTYNLQQNLGSTDVYNGGIGNDTLTMTMTSSQYNAYSSDITGALAFVSNNSNTASATGPTYAFAHLGLTISNVENINIVITANSNPVAHQDDFAGQQGQTVTGNLLANNGHGAASDPDGDTLAAVAGTVTTAHGGTAVINANGTFTYTPATGYFGTDTFNYTVSDPWGGTATGSAVISINAPPAIQSANFSGQENNTVSGNLLSSASDPDGGTLTAVAGTIATSHGGSVALSANGSFVYTPSAGFYGADSFNWSVSDGHGGTATGTVSVHVNAPPAIQPENFSGQENQPVSGNLLAGASDPDGGALTAVAGTIATAHGGSVALAADGTFTYTAAAGFFGADSFNWTVADGQGGTATGAVSLSINAPPAAQQDGFSGFKNQGVSGNVLADNGHGADADPDGGTLAVQAGTLATAHGGQVVLNGDGTFTYTPANGFTGADTFNYTLADGQGGTATGTVNLALADRAPVAQSDDVTVAEDQILHGNVLADNGHGADADPDGDAITVTAGTFTTAQGGTVVVQANGDFTYTSTTLFHGADSFTYTESDGTLSAGATVNITVTPVNHSPVAQNDDVTVAEDQVLHGNVLADNGHGADTDPDGDVITVTAGTFTTAQGGTVVVQANGDFTYTSTSLFRGADSFTYTESDGTLSAGATVNINVTPVNHNPVAQQDDFAGINNQPVTGNVLANNGHGADSDPDGDPLGVTAAIIATAAGGQVSIAADGSFTYTAASGYTGADSFNYTLHDNNGGSATGTVDLTIAAPAHLPPVAQEDDFFTPQGHAVSGNVLADNGHGADSDPNGDSLSVLAATITTAAGGHVTLNADGSFSYTPAAGYTGADTFTYTLANSDGLQAPGTVDLTVAAVTSHPHEFSSSNVLFPAVIEGTNIAYLVPPGTPALGVLHGELDIGNATQATVTFEQSVAGYSNTLGSFVIAADGTIEDTNVLFANAHQQAAGQQYAINLPAEAGAQLGFFIISDGASQNPSLNGMIHGNGTFNFYYDYGHADQRLANVNDSGANVSLVYTNHGGHDTVLQGADYFTTERGGSMALNADDATHVVSGLASAGDTSQLRMSFEDLPNTGDADYNDLIFSVSMNSTTNTTTDAGGNTALVGSAGLYGAAPETFNLDSISSTAENVVDFKTGSGGDALDITNILHGYDSLSDLFSSFVEATSSGGNTTIAVNADGHTGGSFVPVAVLEGVTATLADLVTDGNLLAAHSA